MSKRGKLFPSGEDLIGMVAERRLTFFPYHIEKINIIFRTYTEEL